MSTLAELPSDIRDCRAYREGKIAFRESQKEEQNPYAIGGDTSFNRMAWFTGFFDARSLHKFGGLFARHGLSFPVIAVLAVLFESTCNADYEVEVHRKPVASSAPAPAPYEVEVHVAEVAAPPVKNPIKYAVMLSAGKRQALASGVNTAAGIVTCAHVIEGHAEFKAVCDGETALAKVVSVDKKNDLALLSVAWKGQHDQANIAVGHPSDGETLTSVGRTNDGTIAAESHRFLRLENNEYLHTNATNAGRSGSGIFNARGQLVGLVLGNIVDVEPYLGRSAVVGDIANLIKARRPVQATAAAIHGLHSHQCPKCGHVWSHGSDSFGNTHDHTCPACGKAVVWDVAAVSRPVSKPMVVSGSVGGNCPSGNCPVQRQGPFGMRVRR
jgi:predicted RNA-binding Zn-ribbon protein involved in translation (DUF1610 family)